MGITRRGDNPQGPLDLVGVHRQAGSGQIKAQWLFAVTRVP